MVVYLDVLFLSLAICCFWILRLTGLLLRSPASVGRTLAVAFSCALLQSALLSAGLSVGWAGKLWWDLPTGAAGLAFMAWLLRAGRRKRWKAVLGAAFAASFLYGCGLQGSCLALGTSAGRLSSPRFWLLLNVVGAAEAAAARWFCFHIWRQKLTYGVVLMLREKHYFFRGYCDTGNFLRDKNHKGVWILEQQRFEQLKEWNPSCRGSLSFTSASGTAEQMETLEVEKVRLTAPEGVVMELSHVTVAKGGVFFRQPYDILLPYDIVWKA